MKRESPSEDGLTDLDRVPERFSAFLIRTDACAAALLFKRVRNRAKVMKNRRRFKRYDIDAPVQIELIQSRRKQKVIESHVVDLSAVGGFFPDVKSLPLGQLLKVDIFLPFEGPNPSVEKHDLITMTVTGQVVRSGSSGTAIAFTEEYGLTSRTICKGAEERAECAVAAEGRGTGNRYRNPRG
ncbi:MAG: hypothetical protein C0390_05005 [Syntrophus sp. (in: bacteria)]|nr:hypothetical protein [Syntrophus sp. (in: bacteria)]